MKIGLESRGCSVRISRRALTAALALAVVVVAGAVATAQAQSYSVLYSFQCGSDGAYPGAGLVQDKAGNLYGTTQSGGASSIGTVFKVNPSGTETVLHSFAGYPTDGQSANTALILDGSGNLYGATPAGGAANVGTVFKVAASGTESVLYSFTGAFDGNEPLGSLVRDTAGNLYGTTLGGGGWNAGVVFKLSPGGRETVLHDFNDIVTDGSNPQDGLIQDAAGNLYGTTVYGGVDNAGIIFEVTPTGTESVLHSFLGPPTDGAYPQGGKLVRDSAGNLYGALTVGGAYNHGAVFRLSTTATETVLLNFLGAKEGTFPLDGLTRDPAGNLYGTAAGGSAQCNNCGIIFKLTTAGHEFILHSFAGGPGDGKFPYGGLIRDSSGNLYGTASQGGTYDCGIVFKMTP